MPPHNQTIQWSSPEYRYRKKTPDWFWTVGIIAVAVAVISLFYNDVLSAIFVLLGAFTLMLYGAKQPRTISFSVSERGIRIGNTNYPFLSLKSFWIHEYDTENVLIVESKKLLAPYLHVPIAPHVSVEELHNLFLENLPEKEHRESFSEAIMEYLGF